VGFVVDKSGKVRDVHLRKSIEFILDNEAVRIIENSPQWNAAFQDGRNVNAYRIQPITFVKGE
jgi:protein TonB